MDLFIQEENTLKAGNIKGFQAVKTTVDWVNKIITHEVQYQHRDADGDIIQGAGYSTIKLTPEEFSLWVTAEMQAATIGRINSHVNPETPKMEKQK